MGRVARGDGAEVLGPQGQGFQLGSDTATSKVRRRINLESMRASI